MKHIDELTLEERKEYVKLLGSLVRSVIPEGASFVVIVSGKVLGNYITNTSRQDAIVMMRQTADQVESMQ